MAAYVNETSKHSLQWDHDTSRPVCYKNPSCR